MWLYAWAFACNLTEAELPSVWSYTSLGAFFRYLALVLIFKFLGTILEAFCSFAFGFYHIHSVKLFSKSSLLVKFLTFGSKNVIKFYLLNFLLSLMIQEFHHILSNFLLWSKNFTRQNLLLDFISLELYDPIMSSDSLKLMIQ